MSPPATTKEKGKEVDEQGNLLEEEPVLSDFSGTNLKFIAFFSFFVTTKSILLPSLNLHVDQSYPLTSFCTML
jgi:hypothetical protein